MPPVIKVKGKQVATGSDGIATSNLVDGVLSADAAGRAKLADGFFDSSTVTSKFAAGAIALDRLAEAVLQADGGQQFTGNQDAGAFKITNHATPSDPQDVATKDYVDSNVGSSTWRAPVSVRNYVGNLSVAALNGISPGTCDSYVVTTSGTLTLGSVGVTTGDLVEFNGSIWVLVVDDSGGFPPSGTRALASTTTMLVGPLADGSDDGKIAEWDGTSLTPALSSPTEGFAVIVIGDGACDEGSVFAYMGVVPSGAWSTAGSITFAPTGQITTVNAGDTASGGASSDAARGDHEHAVATATVVNVGTANAEGSATNLARSDHVHNSPKLTTSDKDLTPTATSGDGASTGITISSTPALDSHVVVMVNGIDQVLGDGVKTDDCYFSGDGGTTARATSAITSGDTLYWNGVIAGFDLDTSDRVDLNYLAF